MLTRLTTIVLVGYKGASEADAAAFYCPYIPLMSSGVVLDPQTFEPVVGFLTRYGYVELNNTASSLGNAADYLGKIDSNIGKLKICIIFKIIKFGKGVTSVALFFD
jgi:hypothetical protein